MPVLEIKNITKTFGSLTANDDVSLSLAKGEVLALLGENGAGKTTLMNILFGHYVADTGDIFVHGKKLPSGDTESAIQAGVGMVHQHFTLADNLTVLENIIIGTEPLTAFKFNRKNAINRLMALSDEFGLFIETNKRVAELSVGERQRVEILKVLYRDAKILILDEPTAVLTPQEVTQLLNILKSMVNLGISIIFISHKLHEILEISDRVSVLRHGKIVGDIRTQDADRETLAEMMVGQKVMRPTVEHLPHGAEVVSLNGITVNDEENGNAVLNDVHLKVHEKEIIGLAGVAGNGQSSLAKLLSGLTKPDTGTMSFMGTVLKKHSAKEFMNHGIGRIPEDRHAEGVVGDMTIWENAISERLRDKPFWKKSFWINFKACRHYCHTLIEKFDIRCKTMEMPIKQLSGGNMQKLILARVLQKQPKFILANQPVRGLDEGAIAAVHEKLLDAKSNGAGILLVSEDLDELMGLADKIVVMYHGKLSKPVSIKDVTAQDLGLMMAGDLSLADNFQTGGATSCA